MFRAFEISLAIASLLTESWAFLTFQTGGIFGQGQSRQSQGSVEPFMVKNALNKGKILARLGQQELRDLSDIAGVQVGGDSMFTGYGIGTTPSFGFNLGFGNGQPQESVNPVMVDNALSRGKMLVELGKQELRELSDLAGVQVGGDLLFGGYGANKNPSFGFSLGSNLNLNSPSRTSEVQKSTPQNAPVSVQSTLTLASPPQSSPQSSPAKLIPYSAQPSSPTPLTPPVYTAVNSGAGNNNELVYQPDSLQIPLSLENAEIPQTPLPSSILSPPYKGTFNPLAEDDFHVSFSILHPMVGSKKTPDPIMYPVQFYSPEALKVASIQENPEITLNHVSNYDNFDAW